MAQEAAAGSEADYTVEYQVRSLPQSGYSLRDGMRILGSGIMNEADRRDK